jgi:hypothetical protein
MKLILENWRKYIKENRYAHMQDDRLYRAPAGVPQRAVNIIAGYVIDGIQPSRQDADYLIEFLSEGSASKIVDWYGGKAYRGLMVSEEWLDTFFKVTAKDFQNAARRARERELYGDDRETGEYDRETQEKARIDVLSKPSLVNIFKKLKGEITFKLRGKDYRDSDWIHYDYEGTVLSPNTIIESWSRSYSVAVSYSSPGMGAHYHQLQGFSYFLTSQSEKETPSKVLSVVLEAQAYPPPRGSTPGNGGFIDIKNLYKLVPAMKPERSIKEVPYIFAGPRSRSRPGNRGAGGPIIKKIHIPYRRFQKAFKKATKGFSPQQLKTVSPLIKECASEAGIILTENHPPPSADYILSDPKMDKVRDAMRNKEDLSTLGISPCELYNIGTALLDEKEFADNDEMLDIVMDLFSKCNEGTK